nr:uncharacterized protein LOC131769530 [Pocillopora verrucosa]
MLPKHQLIILLSIVNLFLLQRANSASFVYRDVGRNNATSVTTSSSPVIKVNHGSLVGHPASPTPMKISTLALMVSLLAIVSGAIMLWLIHLVQKRQCTLIRKEFGMTAEDAHLSSTALASNPYQSVSKENSKDVFPMPDAPNQKTYVLTPKISLTCPEGNTSLLMHQTSRLILALRVIASFGHVCARDSVRKLGDENKAVYVSYYTWSSFMRLILGHSVILCQ